MPTQNVIWRPQKGPQHAFVTCPVEEIFFGGARGGGKTDGTLGRALLRVVKYKKEYKGIFIRKTLKQLEPVIARSKEIYSSFGSYNEQHKRWSFKNGAVLTFHYIEREADAENLQGSNLTDIMIEEIGNFPDFKPLLKLKGTLRSTAGVPVCFSSTGNPGGVGQAEIKRRYIDPAPGGRKVIRETDPFTGLASERVYIPSRITDNKLLLQSDPGYLSRLAQTGSEALVRAWLDGDFDAVEGAFFSEFSKAKHVLQQCPLPRHWLRFRAMDWGSYFPFYVCWMAYASETWMHPSGRIIPKGAIVVYRELYGSQNDNNVGLKLPSDHVARMIVQHDLDDKITYGVLDPSAFKVDGGPSNAERMAEATDGKVLFRRADNKRLGQDGAMAGWDVVRSRFQGVEINGEKVPTVYIFDNCKTLIRIVPLAQHKQDHPEDLQIPEAHCLDALRYGLMSRPWGLALPEAEQLHPKDIRHMSFNQLMQEKLKKDRRSRRNSEYLQ